MKLQHLIFLSVLLTLLSLREPGYLAAALGFLLLFSGRDTVQLLRRTLASVLLFNTGVSLGYLLMAFCQKLNPLPYLLMINLKVLTLSYFVALFFRRIDPIRFFSFSRELSFLLTVSLAQIHSYRKVYEEFRLAFKARVATPLYSLKRRFVLHAFDFFFQKAMKDASERTQAMRARGAFL